MGKIRSTLGALLNPSASSIDVVLRISCITPISSNNQSKFIQDEESSVYDSRPYKANYNHTRTTFKPARKKSSKKKDTKNTTMLVSHKASNMYINQLYLTCKFYDRQSYWLNKLAILTEEIKVTEFYIDELPEEYRDFLERYLKILKKVQNDSSKGFLTFVETHPVNSFGMITKEFVPDNCLLAPVPAKSNSSADPLYRKHKKDMRKNNIRRARNNKRKRQDLFLNEWYKAEIEMEDSYDNDQEEKTADISFEVPTEWLEME